MFNVGEIVKYPPKNRRHGVVQYMFCGHCTNCQKEEASACTAAPHVKQRVCVRFPRGDGTYQQFRYDHCDLLYDVPEFSPTTNATTTTCSIAVSAPYITRDRKKCDLSPRDIRILEVVKIDIPLIDTLENDEEIAEEISEKEEEHDEITALPQRIRVGMTFDQYTCMDRRPI